MSSISPLNPNVYILPTDFGIVHEKPPTVNPPETPKPGLIARIS